MRQQLNRMVEVSALPNVNLRVVPADRGFYVGMEGAFTVLSFDRAPDLAYVENVAGAFRIEKVDQVRPCNLAFDRIRSVALDPEESVELIRRVERDL